MDIENLMVLAKPDGRFVSMEMRDAVTKVIASYEILEHLKNYQQYFVYVSGEVASDCNLASAHDIWNESFIENIKSPFGLPRQARDAKCPQKLVHALVECVNRMTPNMGSHWGFKGYALSLLINIQTMSIWDARGAEAT